MCRRALSAALEPLTIICQLVRVFDCGRAPCKGHARNQPNRQNACISHRRLASSRIPRELPGISIPEQLPVKADAHTMRSAETPVYTENLILIDYVTESPNVNGD